MHKINASFDYRKATQALNHFALKEGGQINKMKALKLVYLADRYHLRKYGRLITNDVYFAMPYGAVASGVKDIAEDSAFLGMRVRKYSARYLSLKNLRLLRSANPPDTDVFSESDIEALNFAWEKFGHLNQFDLSKLIHDYPEWAKHKQSLKLNSRVQMDLSDFFNDPVTSIEKCFELADEDKKERREQLEEVSYLESLWG